MFWAFSKSFSFIVLILIVELMLHVFAAKACLMTYQAAFLYFAKIRVAARRGPRRQPRWRTCPPLRVCTIPLHRLTHSESDAASATGLGARDLLPLPWRGGLLSD